MYEFDEETSSRGLIMYEDLYEECMRNFSSILIPLFSFISCETKFPENQRDIPCLNGIKKEPEFTIIESLNQKNQEEVLFELKRELMRTKKETQMDGLLLPPITHIRVRFTGNICQEDFCSLNHLFLNNCFNLFCNLFRSFYYNLIVDSIAEFYTSWLK